jgi:hypothetical protein
MKAPITTARNGALLDSGHLLGGCIACRVWRTTNPHDTVKVVRNVPFGGITPLPSGCGMNEALGDP